VKRPPRTESQLSLVLEEKHPRRGHVIYFGDFARELIRRRGVRRCSPERK
jgi:hypothetical protein